MSEIVSILDFDGLHHYNDLLNVYIESEISKSFSSLEDTLDKLVNGGLPKENQ